MRTAEITKGDVVGGDTRVVRGPLQLRVASPMSTAPRPSSDSLTVPSSRAVPILLSFRLRLTAPRNASRSGNSRHQPSRGGRWHERLPDRTRLDGRGPRARGGAVGRTNPTSGAEHAGLRPAD